MNNSFNAPLWLLLPIVLVFIGYFPATTLHFAQMDDSWMLLDDPLVAGNSFGTDALAEVFTTFNSLQYSPINTLYYKLIYAINGFDPYWYHLSNIILHLLNTYLCYFFVVEINKLFALRDAQIVAFAATLIWAIHPINVEAVIWISASKVLLFSLFGMSSLLFLLKYAQMERNTDYCYAIMLFILSCLCKEQGVLLALVAMLLYLPISYHKSPCILKRWILVCLPFFIIAFILGLIAIYAQQLEIGFNTPVSKYSLVERLIFTYYSLGFYVSGMFLPFDLHYHYEYPIKPGQAVSWIFYVILFVISIAVYWLVTNLTWSRRNVFWVCFFLCHLLLCLHVLPLRRPAVMADRYMYLPGLGVLVMLMSVVNQAFTGSRLAAYQKKLLVSGLVLFFLLLAFTTQAMVFEWQQYNL